MNYKRIAKLTKKQIQGNGTACVLRIPASGDDYNPETDSYDGTAEKHQGTCIVTSYSASAIDGTIIQGRDKKLLCVLPIEPPALKSVIDVYDNSGNVTGTYTVVYVEKICPDNTTVIAYKIQGRA